MSAINNHLPRYTLQFKNGQMLQHQGPLGLAQFRCDARLAHVWQESGAATDQPLRKGG
jgi:hypothetical protein